MGTILQCIPLTALIDDSADCLPCLQALSSQKQAEQEAARLRKEVESYSKEKRQLQGRVGQLAREAREVTTAAEAARRQAAEQQQQVEQLTKQCAAKEVALGRCDEGVA